jgi:Putative prokaryotic signal transducing protein
VATDPFVRDASSMVEVGAYPTRSDAELAQAELAAAGIPSVVSADDAGGAYPFVLAGAARLLVDESDAEDAAAVLADRPQETGKE